MKSALRIKSECSDRIDSKLAFIGLKFNTWQMTYLSSSSVPPCLRGKSRIPGRPTTRNAAIQSALDFGAKRVGSLPRGQPHVGAKAGCRRRECHTNASWVGQFVGVVGEVVPEPSTLTLVLHFLPFVGLYCRMRRN